MSTTWKLGADGMMVFRSGCYPHPTKEEARQPVLSSEQIIVGFSPASRSGDIKDAGLKKHLLPLVNAARKELEKSPTWTRAARLQAELHTAMRTINLADAKITELEARRKRLLLEAAAGVGEEVAVIDAELADLTAAKRQKTSSANAIRDEAEQARRAADEEAAVLADVLIRKERAAIQERIGVLTAGLPDACGELLTQLATLAAGEELLTANAAAASIIANVKG